MCSFEHRCPPGCVAYPTQANFGHSHLEWVEKRVIHLDHMTLEIMCTDMLEFWTSHRQTQGLYKLAYESRGKNMLIV